MVVSGRLVWQGSSYVIRERFCCMVSGLEPDVDLSLLLGSDPGESALIGLSFLYPVIIRSSALFHEQPEIYDLNPCRAPEVNLIFLYHMSYYYPYTRMRGTVCDTAGYVWVLNSICNRCDKGEVIR